MNFIERSPYRTIIFIFICNIVNIGGKILASKLGLPIWLDCIGTVFVSYILGPFCGAVSGFTCNIVYSILFNPASYKYSLANMLIGFLVGYAKKNGGLETFFTSMCTATVMTFVAIAISVPINCFCNEGYTGNIWGDGLIDYLNEHGIAFIRFIIGEFYVDFFDKIFTIMLLYFTTKFYRDMKAKNKIIEKFPFIRIFSVFTVFLTVFLSVCLFSVKNSSLVYADDNIQKFESFTQTIYNGKNGLSCAEVTDIAHTNDGMMWVGTYGGLYKYDGRDFKPISNYSSVRNVRCLYSDIEGRLWIGTNDSGFSIAINENIVNTVNRSDGLPSNAVRCIKGSDDGKCYVATTDGLSVYTLRHGLHKIKTFDNIRSARSIATDNKGNYAVIDKDGVFYYITEEEIKDTKIPSDNESYKAAEFDSDGNLYVASSEDNIFLYKDSSFEKKYQCKDLKNINSLKYYEKNDVIFVCADNGAAYIESDGKCTILKMKEFDNSIEHAGIDYQGNIWFSSSRLGLISLSDTGIADIYKACNVESKVVNTVKKRGNYLYCGTDSGLDIIDTEQKKEVENELSSILDGIRIRCIFEDSQNDLWICSYGKGAVRVKEDGSFEIYDKSKGMFSDNVRVAEETSDHKIIIAGKGLSFIDPDGNVTTFSETDNFAEILCVKEFADGNILAGTDGSGIAVIKDGSVERYITSDDGLSSDIVMNISKSANIDIYYAVTSNCICMIDYGYDITPLENFPYYNNYNVWPYENGTLLVPGSSGIYVVNESELLSGDDDLSYDLINYETGLTSALTANSWNYLDDNGIFYAAASKGVEYINIGKYALNNNSYRMRVTSISLDNVPYQIERGVPFVIPRDVNKISITPEIINFMPKTPYVRYHLMGFDNTAVDVPLSKLTDITYTNIPSGEYTFCMSVLGRDGKTVIEENRYTIVKENAFYDSKIFVIYSMVGAIIIAAWFTWLVFRLHIQRVIDADRNKLEFAEKQLQMSNETIMAVAKALDAKDGNTSQHSARVSMYSVMIAKELGYDQKSCENLRRAALLHDIGKIGIPDSILLKPAKLTDEEYAQMKTHVTKGADILKNFTLIENVVEGALYHHERYDGKGYMQGLKGEEIPIYGRIIGVADAFDAMTANRVYRKQLDIDYVLSELERCKGTQFDPEMADIMINLVKSGKVDVNKLYEKAKKSAEDDKE
ncbi:MAG: HD domain-containing protein [Firmicutes bacterium]|nr:HD domain-containing protein [Bacillota bacterium]